MSSWPLVLVLLAVCCGSLAHDVESDAHDVVHAVSEPVVFDSVHEALISMSSTVPPTPEELGSLKQNFARITQNVQDDGTSNDFISKSDVVIALGATHNKEKMESFFLKNDKNKDGKISLKEFVNIWHPEWDGESTTNGETNDVTVSEGFVLNVKELAEAAHTNSFEKSGAHRSSHLVLRRGQTYTIKVQSTGPVKLNGKQVESHEADGKWWVKFSKNLQDLAFLLHIPANAEFRRNKLSIGTKMVDLVVLFNPWCTKDSVYFKETEKLGEYMGQDTRIWDGTGNAVDSIVWYTGQSDVLEEILKMFEIGEKTTGKVDRTSPVDLARKATRFIYHDGGTNAVILGKWEAPFSCSYADCRGPMTWSDSRDIFQLWRKQNYHPVRWAQCRVFGGVLTTVLRGIGIPSRPITNFQSAHDTRMNSQYENHFDWIVYQEREDSIWNYHVWVEGWMRRNRPHCETGCWNAVDATPQEKSKGHHQMGPAALPDVKRSVRASYDADFVIGEVNSHVWTCGDVGWSPNRKYTRCLNQVQVGHMIATRRWNCSKIRETKSKFDPTIDCFNNLAEDYKLHDDPYAIFNFKNSPEHFKHFVEFEGKGYASKWIRVGIEQVKLVTGHSVLEMRVECDSVNVKGIHLGALRSGTKLVEEKVGGRWGLVLKPEDLFEYASQSNSVRCKFHALHTANGNRKIAVRATKKFNRLDYHELPPFKLSQEPLPWEFHSQTEFNIKMPEVTVEWVKGHNTVQTKRKELELWHVKAGEKIELAVHFTNPWRKHPITIHSVSVASEFSSSLHTFKNLVVAPGKRARLVLRPFSLFRNTDSDAGETSSADVTIGVDTAELLDLKRSITFQVAHHKIIPDF